MSQSRSAPFLSILGGRLRRWVRDDHWTWADADATPERRVFDLTEEQAQQFGMCASDEIHLLAEEGPRGGPLCCVIASEYRTESFPGGTAGAWWSVADERDLLERAFDLGWDPRPGFTAPSGWKWQSLAIGLVLPPRLETKPARRHLAASIPG